MAKQDCQITLLDHTGTPTLYHPETNADQVVTGSTQRVPKISQITNWEDRNTEVINARKGERDLKTKIDNIDTSLQPLNLLNSIKGVDGTGTGLDADKVDGKDVNDAVLDSNTLWTATKINSELKKKLDANQVTSSPEPNKLLLLGGDRKLATDLKGNADTATRLSSPVKISLTGDATGSFSISGNGESISSSVVVVDDSHNHSKITRGDKSIEAGKSNIADFKVSGRALSSIDEDGNFTGSAKKVGGLSVSDELETGALWTCDRISKELGKLKKELQGEMKIEDDQGIIRLGALKVRYGSIALGGARTQQSIEFEESFSKVLFSNYSLETSDASLNCVKLPGETEAGLRFLLSKPPLDGSISWFVVGI